MEKNMKSMASPLKQKKKISEYFQFASDKKILAILPHLNDYMYY